MDNMTRISASQSTLKRMKGTLCFSSNYSAVIFVRDPDSDAKAVNWNILTDANTFAEFRRFFDVRTTRVENSFFLDASVSELIRWIDQYETIRQSGLHTFNYIEAERTRSVREDIAEITSPSMIPQEWRHTPIEVFIKAVNFRVASEIKKNKLCLIMCDAHTFNFESNLSNLEIVEVVKTSFRDASLRSSTGVLSSRSVRHAVLLGHAGCELEPRTREATELFEALVNEGWSSQAAQAYLAPRYPISEELNALRKEYNLIKRLWKSVTIAPLFFNHFTRELQLPAWYSGMNYRVEADDLFSDLTS